MAFKFRLSTFISALCKVVEPLRFELAGRKLFLLIFYTSLFVLCVSSEDVFAAGPVVEKRKIVSSPEESKPSTHNAVVKEDDKKSALEESQNLDVSEKISILNGFFSKKLNKLSELQLALGPSWLTDNDAAMKAVKVLEQKLFQAKENEKNLTEPQKKEAELISLQLQWLKLTPAEKEQLLSDLKTKEITKETDDTADKLLKEAKEETAESEKKRKELEGASRKTVDEREADIIATRLDLEKTKQDLLESKKAFAQFQKSFSEKVDSWTDLESLIRKALESKDGEYLKYGDKLSELLRESNKRSQSRNKLLEFYKSGFPEVDKEKDFKQFVVRESDTDKTKKLIQDIQKSVIDMSTSAEILNHEKQDLFSRLVRWEREYRSKLLFLRGEIVGRMKSDRVAMPGLRKPEPFLQEIRTLGSSTLFSVWSFPEVYLNDDRKDRTNYQIIEETTHLLKIGFFVLFAIFLLVNRKKFSKKIQEFIQNKILKRKRKWAELLSEFFNDLYVFFVLLFLATMIIDFGVGLGFDFLIILRPILQKTLIFFFFWGLIDFLRPVISQRRRRFKLKPDEVRAMEEIFEFFPKLFLIYFLSKELLQELLFQWLRHNFIIDPISDLLKWIFFFSLYFGIWLKRDSWRLVSEKASSALIWQRIHSSSHGKIWEPLILVFGGGLGVYFLAWKIIKTQLGELEFARSFQAMISRALLERKQKHSTTRVVKEHFPGGYLDCFNYQRRALPEWHIKRDESVETLLKAYDRWDAGLPGTTVLLAGDRGIGKSEFIYSFLRTHNLKAKEAKLSPGDTSLSEVCKSLSSQILKKDIECSKDAIMKAVAELEPSVILLENLENCFLRNVGGFDVFSFLIDLIMSTSGKHLWLVTFTPYAWTIAKRAVPSVDCFSHHIYLKGMSEDEIKSLILTRHEFNSGLNLDFTGLSLENGKNKYLKSNQEEDPNIQGRDLYFRILWDYTEGNPRQSLYFWKTSLLFEENTAKVTLFDVPEQSVLEGIRDKTLMVLSALIEHNGLTLNGLSHILHEPEETVRRMVEELMPYEIIYQFGTPSDHNHGWHVESFWIKTVETYLEKRKLLFRGGLR